MEPALLFLKEARLEPRAIETLGLDPPAPARIGGEALHAALEAFLACEGSDEPPAEVWLPGADRARPRDAARCQAEGCPFVSRCFAR
ncbi:MAG: hypothetical protein KIS92_22255 [Planctomycetota bacterium]|nr:hypothetical protein [Planctomycetota bacterium]